MAISQPLMLTPMHVPVTRGMTIVKVGDGDVQILNGSTYYQIVLDVTNGWNIQHDVDIQNLTLWVNSTAVLAISNRTEFTAQTLEPGQMTQFQAFFPLTVSSGAFAMTYDDYGTVIPVQLG